MARLTSLSLTDSLWERIEKIRITAQVPRHRALRMALEMGLDELEVRAARLAANSSANTSAADVTPA